MLTQAMTEAKKLQTLLTSPSKKAASHNAIPQKPEAPNKPPRVLVPRI